MENDKRPVAAGAGARTSPSLGVISHMAEPIPARSRVATSITPLSHHVWVHQGYGAPASGSQGQMMIWRCLSLELYHDPVPLPVP